MHPADNRNRYGLLSMIEEHIKLCEACPTTHARPDPIPRFLPVNALDVYRAHFPVYQLLQIRWSKYIVKLQPSTSTTSTPLAVTCENN